MLTVWALRPHPRRLLRARIAGAFVAIAGACLWRIRPDTWPYPDLVNGDSYFFIPRILLLWLLIWEFDARPRRHVAFAARALCVIGLVLELPHHALPAPRDFHWASLCDPIRRGEPARIPFCRRVGSSIIPAATEKLIAPLDEKPLSAPLIRAATVLRAWWQNPRPAWPVCAALAALLALRKPSRTAHAATLGRGWRHFLSQNDQLGLRAFVEPYQGYLHTLPRLIARVGDISPARRGGRCSTTARPARSRSR